MIPLLSEEYVRLADKSQAQDLIDFAKEQLQINQNNEEAKYWIVHAHFLLGQYEKTVKIGEKLLKEITNNTWIGRVYNRIGTAYFSSGNLKKSMSNYVIAERVLQGHGTKKDLGGVLNNIGLLKELQGDLNTSLKYYQRAVELKRESGKKGSEAGTLVNIGVIYHNIGEYENALRITEEAEKLFRLKDSTPGIAMSLHHQVLTYLEIGHIEKSKEFASKYEEIAKKNLDVSIYQITNELNHALILKNTTSLEAKGEAIVKLREFNDRDDVNINLKLHAVKNLIELKLEEYKLFENKDVLNEINLHITDMDEIAHNNRIYPLVVDLHILKSKMMQIQGNFVEVKNILFEAEKLIEEQGLDHLQMNVEKEYEKFENNLKRMKDVVDKNEKIVKKVEINFLEEYLKSLKL